MEPKFVLYLLVSLLLFSMFSFTGCDGDDDSGSGPGQGPGNDDETDDDAADDDTAEDDDDDNDDNDDNNDDSGPDPYDPMAPAGRTISEILAIASHMSTGPEDNQDRLFEIEMEAQAGIHYVRRGFYWNNIEPADDAWNFAGYDVMVDLLAGAGLSPTAMITRAVSWAAPGGSPSEVDPAVFADFAGTVADRYSDRIDLYEIWNEQNTERFWDGGPNPEHYGLLLQAAYQAIHENDPDAEVLFGGMSPLDTEHLFDPRGVWNFLARVGEAHPNLCDFIDGVAIHPYTFLQQPGPEFSIDWGFYRYPDLVTAVNEARGMIAELGCPDLPIHLTETGWPSLLIGNEHQAAYYPRGALLAAVAGAAGYYWYTFYDEEPGSSIPTEDYFGLYELPDGVNQPNPKPVWRSLLGLQQVVGAGRYAGNLAAALGWAPENYALVFADDEGTWTVALWRTEWDLDAESKLDVPLPEEATGEWNLYDQEGNLLDSGPVDGALVEVSLSGRVKYLQFQ